MTPPGQPGLDAYFVGLDRTMKPTRYEALFETLLFIPCMYREEQKNHGVGQ